MNGRNHAAFAGAVLAVILPALGAHEARAAAPLSAVPSWEGFYIGADAGYGFGVIGTTQPVHTDFLGAHGFSGGGLAGYNHMIAPRWLVGIEGDASWSNVAHNDQISDNFGDFVSLAVGQDQAYSLRARFGYLLAPETLIYGTAGGAWSHFVYSVSDLNFGYADTDLRWYGGGEVGFGVETRLAPGWNARLEYLVALYGRGTLNSAYLGPVELEPNVAVGRIALIYQFGTQAGTAWETRQPKPAWSGFYAVGTLGVGVANAKIGFPQSLGVNITADGVGIPGVIPSAMLGYNWRIAPRWVIGVEGEVAPGISTADFRLDWTEVARGRVGYLLTPATLLYGTAGWVGSGIATTAIIDNTVSIPSQRVSALEVGGGVETALDEHWAVRFDYQYAAAQTINNIAVASAGYTGLVSAQTEIQAARIGVVYMFGGR